jgi:hypothetical protein
MVARTLIGVMALLVGGGFTGSAALADQGSQEAVLREDAEAVVISLDDGDDDGQGGSNSGNSGVTGTSGVDSNDGTNSKVTPVSKDRDRSWDDLTKDRTKDGPGGKKRDWSKNKTNDKSRNDSR